MGKPIDLTGQKFGRLTVIRLSSRINYRAKWECECECGKRTVAFGTNLKRGFTRSCGCLQSESRITHNGTRRPEFWIWHAMRQRCENPNHRAFKHYGDRGITVCSRWGKFENFFEDMGPRPDGMTLERTDTNQGYSKENCVWASWSDQMKNQRRRSDNRTGVTGVIFEKKSQKYRAEIRLSKRSKFLGYFDSIEAAAEARHQAEIRYWGKERPTY